MNPTNEKKSSNPSGQAPRATSLPLDASRSQSYQRPKAKILDWVYRFEKINASTDERHSSGATGALLGEEIGAAVLLTSQLASGVTKVTPPEAPEQDPDLCFKAAQLITELLLILFAASLLIVAAIVIVSKRTPAIMESYEIVPKFLFFLCVFVASFSALRWIISKIRHLLVNPYSGSTQTTVNDATIELGKQSEPAGQSAVNLLAQTPTKSSVAADLGDTNNTSSAKDQARCCNIAEFRDRKYHSSLKTSSPDLTTTQTITEE